MKGLVALLHFSVDGIWKCTFCHILKNATVKEYLVNGFFASAQFCCVICVTFRIRALNFPEYIACLWTTRFKFQLMHELKRSNPLFPQSMKCTYVSRLFSRCHQWCQDLFSQKLMIQKDLYMQKRVSKDQQNSKHLQTGDECECKRLVTFTKLL